QAARFQEVIDWLSPPDPWTNHASARKLHEPHTGKWLLQSGQYQQWKRGDVRHMWFYGKAGCGKTVLSSTVIEDLNLHCDTDTDSRLAIFYFTFSDNRKQTFESLLLSLVQYDKPNRSLPAPAALEEILLSCIAQSGQIFLVLDALDEFRWAFCQLLELKKLKFTKPSHIRTALLALPPTLDETYERILTGIDDICRNDALVLLRWLLYAQRPLRPRELVEATIIDPSGDGAVDTDDRVNDLEGVLDMLAGLVPLADSKPVPRQRTDGDSYVRLAHFSVQEYLESERIGRHSDATKHDLFRVHDPDVPWGKPFRYVEDRRPIGSGFYYASLLGLQMVVDALLDAGCDVDAEGGEYGNALQAALYGDHEEIVKLLIEKGANVNAQEGYYGSALQAASYRGHLKVAEVLLDSGADVHAFGGPFDTALGAASYGGHEEVAALLIKWGADVNVGEDGKRHTAALEWASLEGHDELVKRLLDAGAHVNAQGSWGGALQAAGRGRHEKVILTLIDRGADVNAQGGPYGSVLQAAIRYNHARLAEILIERGADVNARGGHFGSALTLAIAGGNEQMAMVLLEQGAYVNGLGGRYGSALQAAIQYDHEKVAEMLVERGADVNALGGEYGSALSIASKRRHWKLARMLTQHGAVLDPSEPDNWDWAALWYCEEL
ncbi:ankyrin repeat-containing domain protein, partial [Neohortaea acidophila]